MIPNSGGFYAYASRAFGPRIGFVVGCLNAVVESVAMAYLSVALGEFAAGLFPRLAGHVQLVGVTGLGLADAAQLDRPAAGQPGAELPAQPKPSGLIGLVIACFVSPAASGAAVVTRFSIARTRPFPGINPCSARRGRYLRRLVRTHLFCRGRSRPLAKSAALHDRHCAHLHRHLPADECGSAPYVGNGPSRGFAAAGRGCCNVGFRQLRKTVHSAYLRGWCAEHHQRRADAHAAHSFLHGSRWALATTCEHGEYREGLRR